MDNLDFESLVSLILAEGVTMGNFGIALRHEGTTTFLTCSGDLSDTQARNLARAVEIALSTQPEQLIVDTSLVHAIGSDGVAALVEVRNRCLDENVRCALLPGPIVADALEQAHLAWLYDTSGRQLTSESSGSGS